MSKWSTAATEGFIHGSLKKAPSVQLPLADNTPDALAALLAANIQYRQEP